MKPAVFISLLNNKFVIFYSMMEEIVKTKTKKIDPKIQVDEGILAEVQNETDVEKQVIIHCFLKSDPYGMNIRIWRSTYLRDRDSSHKSKLLIAHNISFYPHWKTIQGGRNAKFSLIFSSLPKTCKFFDLLEDIPQSGGFYTGLILRNKSDVYSVNIYS